MKTQLFTLFSTAILAAQAIGAAPTIERESNGNRDALTALECAPMNPDTFAMLTDWSHPGTLDQSNIQGKVVLLAIVSATDPQSIMTISKLSRMEREFEDQGLIVAAIHPDAGYETVTERVSSGKIKIPIARDQGNTLASALYNDDYPDLYLIDRAGNLRFADFDKGSLKDALSLLNAETPESASTNADRQSQGLEPVVPEQLQLDDPKPATRGSRSTKANWPPHNSSEIYADLDSQGKPLPIPLGNETPIMNQRDYEGKVVIIEFWNASCSPCRKTLKTYNALLEENPDTLEVIGISHDEDIARLNRELDKGKRAFPQLHDAERTLYNKLQITATPHAVVLSTDGIIRWQGFPTTRSFKEVVEQIIAADPRTARVPKAVDDDKGP